MPGPTIERPRAHRLTDIEPQTAKALGCGKSEDFDTPISSGSNMGSIARFPKLDECAHFHYEHIELITLEVCISDDNDESDTYAIRVTSGDACWTLQRSYENFVMFDKQLHRCIFDRKFSSLAKLPETKPKNTCDILKEYLKRFSQLNHDGLNCGPVLNWLQLDNRGRRILVPESDSCPINTPAVAAAYAVRPYTAQAQDEISFQVGDMISVIDMPPPGESNWWRGKHGFAVGFFPADCVAVIGDKVPRHLTVSTTIRSKLPVKPVLRKHGKLIAFFRSFILNRPSRRRLKQSGILKERVFGCDLGEHLLNSGQDVPTVLTCCAEFIENHGLVDGIYRLSGVTSNIQRLRNAFDEDRVPALHSDEGILQDIHSVASLLKMYFRELPNPLCTYQLYSTFVSAVQASTDAERLRRMRDAVRKLPPPHYRTLEYLMRHLVKVAARGAETGMTPRNVAIVWAPNLLRCKELEVGGVAALQGVGVQAVVTEFLVCYAELIFGDGPMGRPKSLAITTPARLLSLEEARSRTIKNDTDYIEVGAGPAGLPMHYHTVIELPRKRNGSKRSPSLNWRALFGRGGLGARGTKTRQVGTPPQPETVPSSLNSLRRLRPVKSADSLDGEDSLGPLLGPPPTRPCGHSRSVSHDSYFDHLADAPTSTSPLDLSEIQLNFDLEEREMRMLSEEESGGIDSIEASPRRQRVDAVQSVVPTGGSKRKRSRLEERLHCDVELRFIDSQSPDQVMVSADIHNMDSPSPLATPGYLPLLSEASTPLTPATLQGTPHSTSPIPSNSPRISFRSFTLPLDLDIDQSNNRSSVSSDKTSNPSHRLSINLLNQNNSKSCERIGTYENDVEIYTKKFEEASRSRQSVLEPSTPMNTLIFDQEMTPCERLISPNSEVSCSRIDSPNKERERSCDYNEDKSHSEYRNINDGVKDDSSNHSACSRNGEPPGTSNAYRNESVALPESSVTDLDSPMSCEQTLEDLPDSGFVICDSSDKMFTNTETQQILTNTNDSGEWVIVERTGSITTPTSESESFKDPLEGTINPAIATDPPQLRSRSENMSRTSLDLTMGSTVDTDTSCIGASDLTESPIGDISLDVADKDCRDRETDSDDLVRCAQKHCNVSEQHINCKDDYDNGNQSVSNVNLTIMQSIHESCKIDHDSNYSRLDNKVHQKNQNTNHSQDNSTLKSRNYSENTVQLTDKCQNFEKNIEEPQNFNCPNNYSPKRDINSLKRQKSKNIRLTDETEVVIPSESAAEPCDIAHPPEGASESSLDSSFSNASSIVDDSVVLRDTAAILQELALQRLSGGFMKDVNTPKRRQDADQRRDFKSLDPEIQFNRDIVKEARQKMKQEVEMRSKTDESLLNNASHLPPCLRARHARATRIALSRSLDEAKFNQMASESSLRIKQTSDDTQHSSTPNVGVETALCAHGQERVYLKHLSGLDLGDPQCRERIEKYKEERRTFLRDKYRSESFRGSTSKTEDDSEQALLARLKQRASRPSLH